MPSDGNEIREIIKQSAGFSKSMTVGSESVQERNLDELIKADEYLDKVDAAKDPLSCIQGFRILGGSIR